MASAEVESCHDDSNFAVICSFVLKFGGILGINMTIAQLQEMLEDTKNVPEPLLELLIRLLRKCRKWFHKEKWEKAMIKFCHEYSSVDAWELERFGFKKAKLSVKLEMIKRLLELQFDGNSKFKTEVNKQEATELRLLPIGRDLKGHTYWLQRDEEMNLRIYQEEAEEDASWKLLCRSRDELGTLLHSLQQIDGMPPRESTSSSNCSENGDSNLPSGVAAGIQHAPTLFPSIKEEDEEDCCTEDKKPFPIDTGQPEKKLASSKCEERIPVDTVLLTNPASVESSLIGKKIKVEPDEQSPTKPKILSPDEIKIEHEEQHEIGSLLPKDKEKNSHTSTESSHPCVSDTSQRKDVTDDKADKDSGVVDKNKKDRVVQIGDSNHYKDVTDDNSLKDACVVDKIKETPVASVCSIMESEKEIVDLSTKMSKVDSSETILSPEKQKKEMCNEKEIVPATTSKQDDEITYDVSEKLEKCKNEKEVCKEQLTFEEKSVAKDNHDSVNLSKTTVQENMTRDVLTQEGGKLLESKIPGEVDDTEVKNLSGNSEGKVDSIQENVVECVTCEKEPNVVTSKVLEKDQEVSDLPNVKGKKEVDDSKSKTAEKEVDDSKSKTAEKEVDVTETRENKQEIDVSKTGTEKEGDVIETGEKKLDLDVSEAEKEPEVDVTKTNEQEGDVAKTKAVEKVELVGVTKALGKEQNTSELQIPSVEIDQDANKTDKPIMEKEHDVEVPKAAEKCQEVDVPKSPMKEREPEIKIAKAPEKECEELKVDILKTKTVEEGQKIGIATTAEIGQTDDVAKIVEQKQEVEDTKTVEKEKEVAIIKTNVIKDKSVVGVPKDAKTVSVLDKPLQSEVTLPDNDRETLQGNLAKAESTSLKSSHEIEKEVLVDSILIKEVEKPVKLKIQKSKIQMSNNKETRKFNKSAASDSKEEVNQSTSERLEENCNEKVPKLKINRKALEAQSKKTKISMVKDADSIESQNINGCDSKERRRSFDDNNLQGKSDVHSIDRDSTVDENAENKTNASAVPEDDKTENESESSKRKRDFGDKESTKESKKLAKTISPEKSKDAKLVRGKRDNEGVLKQSSEKVESANVEDGDKPVVQKGVENSGEGCSKIIPRDIESETIEAVAKPKPVTKETFQMDFDDDFVPVAPIIPRISKEPKSKSPVKSNSAKKKKPDQSDDEKPDESLEVSPRPTRAARRSTSNPICYAQPKRPAQQPKTPPRKQSTEDSQTPKGKNKKNDAAKCDSSHKPLSQDLDKAAVPMKADATTPRSHKRKPGRRARRGARGRRRGAAAKAQPVAEEPSTEESRDGMPPKENGEEIVQESPAVRGGQAKRGRGGRGRGNRGRGAKVSTPSLATPSPSVPEDESNQGGGDGGSSDYSSTRKRSVRIKKQEQKRMIDLAEQMEIEQRRLEALAKENVAKKLLLTSSPAKKKDKDFALCLEEEEEDSSKDEDSQDWSISSKSAPRNKHWRRRKRKKKGPVGSKPWERSSGSSTEEEEEPVIEEEWEDREEEEEKLKFDENYDEFACEEVVEGEEPVTLRRARTLKRVFSGSEDEAENGIDNDDKPCGRCKQSDHPEWILLCDQCDAGYHTSCLKPPLMIIPSGDWFCPPCEHNKLCDRLFEELKVFDQLMKKREREELRKQRLAYVGISLDNVLKTEKKETIEEEIPTEEQPMDQPEPELHSETDSSEEDKENDPRHKKKKKKKKRDSYLVRSSRQRTAVSYRFQEYDDLIASALQAEIGEHAAYQRQLAAAQQASTQNQNVQAASAEPGTEAGAVEGVAVEKAPIHKLPADGEAREEEDKDEEEEEEEEEEPEEEEDENPYQPVVKRPANKRKKQRPLGALTSSEDDEGDAKDHDYQGSSGTDTEVSKSAGSYEEEEESGDSDWQTGRGRRGKGRKRRRSGSESDGSEYRPGTRRAVVQKRMVSYKEVSSEEEWGTYAQPKTKKRKKKKSDSEDSEDDGGDSDSWLRVQKKDEQKRQQKELKTNFFKDTDDEDSYEESSDESGKKKTTNKEKSSSEESEEKQVPPMKELLKKLVIKKVIPKKSSSEEEDEEEEESSEEEEESEEEESKIGTKRQIIRSDDDEEEDEKPEKTEKTVVPVEATTKLPEEETKVVAKVPEKKGVEAEVSKKEVVVPAPKAIITKALPSNEEEEEEDEEEEEEEEEDEDEEEIENNVQNIPKVVRPPCEPADMAQDLTVSKQARVYDYPPTPQHSRGFPADGYGPPPPPDPQPTPQATELTSLVEDYSNRPSPLKPSMVETGSGSYPSSPAKLTSLDNPPSFTSSKLTSIGQYPPSGYRHTPSPRFAHHPAEFQRNAESHYRPQGNFPAYPPPQGQFYGPPGPGGYGRSPPPSPYPIHGPPVSPSQEDYRGGSYPPYPPSYHPGGYPGQGFYPPSHHPPGPHHPEEGQPSGGPPPYPPPPGGYSPPGPGGPPPPGHGGPYPYYPQAHQPNGGFMIDNLLRSRPEGGEEDDLTGVTDIVSYVMQE